MNTQKKRLSKLSKLSKLTKSSSSNNNNNNNSIRNKNKNKNKNKTKSYLIENINPSLWNAFKLICNVKGSTIKREIIQALIQYVQTNQVEQMHVNIKVIENHRRNLLTFVYEEDIRNLLTAMIEAKKREAPLPHIIDLKHQVLALLKKHPQVSEQLAEEVTQVFKVIQ